MRSGELEKKELNELLESALVVEASVEEIRKFIDSVEDEELTNALDNAQGEVHMGNTNRAYVIIVITP